MTGTSPIFSVGPERSAESLRVRVGAFDGPLDLLLHLVRIHELDVRDLPIAEVARQYQEYLDLMRELDLEIAGEYLLMAATLLHIKSRMLLPAEAPRNEEETSEDPRSALVAELLEYQRVKQAAESLAALDSARSLVWTRGASVPEELLGEETIEADLFDLLRAFRSLLERLGEEARLRVRRDRISIADRIVWLGERLEALGRASFFELFETLADRAERIATFLALLEMIRMGRVAAYQQTPFGDVLLVWKAEHQAQPAALP